MERFNNSAILAVENVPVVDQQSRPASYHRLIHQRETVFEGSRATQPDAPAPRPALGHRIRRRPELSQRPRGPVSRRRIVYHANSIGHFEIYALKTSGAGLRQLTHTAVACKTKTSRGSRSLARDRPTGSYDRPRSRTGSRFNRWPPFLDGTRESLPDWTYWKAPPNRRTLGLCVGTGRDGRRRCSRAPAYPMRDD